MTTPTFDFSAFLNSPAAGGDNSRPWPDASRGPPVAQPMEQSASSEPESAQQQHNQNGNANDNGQYTFADMRALFGADQQQAQQAGDITGIRSDVDWATGAHPPANHDMQVDAQINGADGANAGEMPITNDYRARIAAHHSSQLRHWLPSMPGSASANPAGLGGPGQRGATGSYSSPSVPLSQSSVRPTAPMARPSLTIQERRRLSRRQAATGKGSNLNPQVSGRSHKRQMDAGDEIISSPSAMADSEPAQTAHSVSGVSGAFPPPGSSLAGGTEFSPVYAGQYSTVPGDHPLAQRPYSASGFDLIGALMRVAQRTNPRITIGPVDLSCSFTVADARLPDQPIIHCSDTFCHLTGYTREEVIGRNCRFLQAPDGEVPVGSERAHTDNRAVQHIKKHCVTMQECQTSLINYRKDGSPFINLVTIVPIHWGNSPMPVLLVGFQVDLVEQPGAILERKADGTYVVNYSQTAAANNNGAVPMPISSKDTVPEPPAQDPAEAEASKRIMAAKEVADIIASGSTDTSQWARVLLENSHDLIHVLSLKGTFLYVSPSSEKILGFKPEEMVGRSISEFCHPSDVVPVFRELKDSTSNSSIAAAARHSARVDGTYNPITKGGAGQTGPPVNLIMRMRHKNLGHVWVENVGKLHLEQGKGRKVVISSGRPRPVHDLPWEDARSTLDNKEPGFWSKLSTEGLFLSATGSVESVLGASIDASLMNGRHVNQLVSPDAISVMLLALRGAQIVTILHGMKDTSTGRPVQVQSTIYPTVDKDILPSVFMHTQRMRPDATVLQPNVAYPRDKVGGPQPPGPRLGIGSVFQELSELRSTSWVFELHQLKNANKRLREEVRLSQRRAQGTHHHSARNSMSGSVAPVSPHKSYLGPGAQHEALLRAQARLHDEHSASPSTNSGNGSSGREMGPIAGNGSGSGTGSGSEDTAATSGISDLETTKVMAT